MPILARGRARRKRIPRRPGAPWRYGVRPRGPTAARPPATAPPARAGRRAGACRATRHVARRAAARSRAPCPRPGSRGATRSGARASCRRTPARRAARDPPPLGVESPVDDEAARSRHEAPAPGTGGGPVADLGRPPALGRVVEAQADHAEDRAHAVGTGDARAARALAHAPREDVAALPPGTDVLLDELHRVRARVRRRHHRPCGDVRVLARGRDRVDVVEGRGRQVDVAVVEGEGVHPPEPGTPRRTASPGFPARGRAATSALDRPGPGCVTGAGRPPRASTAGRARRPPPR